MKKRAFLEKIEGKKIKFKNENRKTHYSSFKKNIPLKRGKRILPLRRNMINIVMKFHCLKL